MILVVISCYNEAFNIRNRSKTIKEIERWHLTG